MLEVVVLVDVAGGGCWCWWMLVVVDVGGDCAGGCWCWWVVVLVVVDVVSG